MSSTTATTSTGNSESLLDRKKQRELQQARQSGAVAPAVDAKTGQMINPHNPDFITKRPWYLDASAAAESEGPSLDHQQALGGDQKKSSDKYSLLASERALEQERLKQKQQQQQGLFTKGQWVEALKKNKPPYRICQIIKIHHNNSKFDLQYEDGTIERNVKNNSTRNNSKPRIRMTKTGSRSSAGAGAATSEETFDSKRDQYHGYDKDSHNVKLAAKYEQREALRRQLRQDNNEKDDDDDNDNDAVDDDSDFEKRSVDSDDDDDDDNMLEDEFVQRDEDAKVLTTRLARQGGVGGAQMKVTARNLRIREDTAKYLRNLDIDSAYYDPKSRSMRDNPNPHIPADQCDFAGDNFSRTTGEDVRHLAETQLFAWDAAQKIKTQSDGGNDNSTQLLHPQANPSQAELLQKEFQSKASQLKTQRQQRVLDKYGGEEYLDGSGGLAAAAAAAATKKKNNNKPTTDRKLRFGVSTAAEEQYDNNTRDGQGAVDGEQRRRHHHHPIESKYEEDVFVHGHVSVWGSYFHKGAFTWGYADDHSLLKNSYGTGQAGRLANDEANEMRYGTGKAGSAALAQARGMLKVLPGQQQKKNSENGGAPAVSRSKLYGEADLNAQLDQDKVQQALHKAKNEEEEAAANDKKKRKYHSMNADVDMTEEDMEAYRMRKERTSDPMASIGSDELLDYKK